MMTFGLIQVYTGNGKGKTTAALGLATRMLGYGYKVAIIQLMKGWEYGEEYFFNDIDNCLLKKFGRKEFVDKNSPAKIDIQLAEDAWEFARKVIESKEYQLVILDELNVALDFKLLPLHDILDFLRHRPPGIEIVITGRYAPKELLDMADLVSEVEEYKHPYKKGISARKGIEY